MIRPYRVKDSSGRTHTFSTIKKANEYKENNPGSHRTARAAVIARTSDKRDVSLAKQFQSSERAKGNVMTLKETLHNKQFRRAISTLRSHPNPAHRFAVLQQLGRTPRSSGNQVVMGVSP